MKMSYTWYKNSWAAICPKIEIEFSVAISQGWVTLYGEIIDKSLATSSHLHGW